MAILFRYPVIDLDPSIPKIFSNYEKEHIIDLGIKGAAGFSMGYFITWISRQANPGVKIPRYHIVTTVLGVGLGLITNSTKITYQFQGYAPNDHLINKYGALSEPQILLQLREQGLKQPSSLFSLLFLFDRSPKDSRKKFPIISLFPRSNQIFMNWESNDYARIVLSGLLFYGAALAMTKLMTIRRSKLQLDRPVRESFHHFFLLHGLLMGIANEYNNSYLRLLGLAPNASEEGKYGRLTGDELIREVLSNLFPEVDFDGVDFRQVLLAKECIAQLQTALEAKFPYCDLSSLQFKELSQHSGSENKKVVKLITSAGYQNPSHLILDE